MDTVTTDTVLLYEAAHVQGESAKVFPSCNKRPISSLQIEHWKKFSMYAGTVNVTASLVDYIVCIALGSGFEPSTTLRFASYHTHLDPPLM